MQLATFGRLLNGQNDELVGFELSAIKIEDPEIAAAVGKAHHANVVRTGREESRVRGMAFEITRPSLRLRINMKSAPRMFASRQRLLREKKCGCMFPPALHKRGVAWDTFS